MAQFIKSPVIIKAAGNKEKIIYEFFGLVNSESSEVSIAHMTSPEGWEEPGQCPKFNEYTAVCLPAFYPDIVNRDAEQL